MYRLSIHVIDVIIYNLHILSWDQGAYIYKRPGWDELTHFKCQFVVVGDISFQLGDPLYIFEWLYYLVQY